MRSNPVKLMKQLLLLVLVFPTLTFAQTETQEDRLAELLVKFPAADADKDGILTIAEARAFRDKRQAEPKAERSKRSANRPDPTFADVVYGPHERNRLDVWIPEESPDDLPFPVVIYFHGGGFVGGDKSGFDPTDYLEAGIACASVNYRFVNGDDSLSDAPLADAARAVQTVRAKNTEWNIDTGRVALTGSSAGALMVMWIGLHDDMANPDSEDPVETQSTRVTCILPINGPTNLMPDWILENIGGPAHVHGSFVKMFGQTADSELKPEVRAQILEVSPWEHVSSDDPPVFLVYNGDLDEVPLPETVSTGKLIHHPQFGKALKAKLAAAGVEAEFRYGFDPRGKPDLVDWLRTKFGLLE